MRSLPLPLNDPAALARAWNTLFPFDYWWRQKFNVPFGSPTHLAMSLWDEAAEYEQERWVQEFRQQLAQPAPTDVDEAGTPLTIFKTSSQADYTSQAEVDADFDDLDIDADFSPVTPSPRTQADSESDDDELADDYEE